MTTTLTFWEKFLWFYLGVGALGIPAGLWAVWVMHRDRKRPPRKPADPEEMRQVAADLARLSRTIARMAETEEPVPKEEVRANA